MANYMYDAPSGCGCGGHRSMYPGAAFFPFPAFYPLKYISVSIAGGRSFPELASQFSVPFAHGLSIAQALGATNAVRFFKNGQIATVYGIPIVDKIDCQLTLNGRSIPNTLLSFPVQPNDRIEITLNRLPIYS